jgi:hypothetical protein
VQAAQQAFFDFYGLPDNFPGCKATTGNAFQKVRFVENAFEKDINDRRFSAYLSLHEFESLLFSSPPEIAKTLNAAEKEPELRAIRKSFASPEEINDNPKTAPSKRLRDHFPRYNKVFFGRLIAKRVYFSNTLSGGITTLSYRITLKTLFLRTPYSQRLCGRLFKQPLTDFVVILSAEKP